MGVCRLAARHNRQLASTLAAERAENDDTSRLNGHRDVYFRSANGNLRRSAKILVSTGSGQCAEILQRR